MKKLLSKYLNSGSKLCLVLLVLLAIVEGRIFINDLGPKNQKLITSFSDSNKKQDIYNLFAEDLNLEEDSDDSKDSNPDLIDNGLLLIPPFGSLLKNSESHLRNYFFCFIKISPNQNFSAFNYIAIQNKESFLRHRMLLI